MTIKRLTVAIDGPAGAGKSTVARLVATALGYAYIDTGAMYRAIAWKALREGCALTNEPALTRLAEDTVVEFLQAGEGTQRVLVDGADVSESIRLPEVTQYSSPVSAVSGVRRALVAQQRRLGEGGGVVMEGRDIGTVVFPNAEVKVLLTASVEERARRRAGEMVAKGIDADVKVVEAEIRERDSRDSSRQDSPLRAADDAVTVGTDGLTIGQVVERILTLCRERGGLPQ